MKKKILIVSLAVNIIAGAFVFYSFTSKTKSVNDVGGYIVMCIAYSNDAELSISDGNSILDKEELDSYSSQELAKANNMVIAKKINELRAKGYELITSSSGSGHAIGLTNYIFAKK